MTSSWGGARRAHPFAFTGQGVAMLSTVLRSRRAAQVNVAIMRAFVSLRKILGNNETLARKLSELERRLDRHDKSIRSIFDAIRELMSPPPGRSVRLVFTPSASRPDPATPAGMLDSCRQLRQDHPVSTLARKVLVIVGGTAGIGLSAAHAFLAAGAKVVVIGRDPANVKAARKSLGKSSRVLAGDATRPETAAKAIRAAVKCFGGFHGLYHVAGGSGRKQGDGPLHTIPDEGWDYTVNLNLTSLFLSNRAAVRQFLHQGSGGSILNMSSVLGFAPSPEFFGTHAYATAKAAIVGLTRSAAATYAAQDIRINVLAPALVATPMSRRAQGDQAILRFIHGKQPLDGGRIGRPEDLDAAAVYFMSDGSKFVTGQVLAVDGGWTVSEGRV